MSDITKKPAENQNRIKTKVVTPNVTISVEFDASPSLPSGDVLSTSPRTRRFTAEPIMTNKDDSPPK